LLPVGHQISVRHFVPGQWVFCSGHSKAKGYQGVMKRWGFSGLDNYANDASPRAPGSMGQRGIGKIWKYKKTEGHMGPDPRCTNCKVFRIESTRNLLFLKGQLPGHKGHVVKIHDARGVTQFKNAHIKLPYPSFVPVPAFRYPTTMQEPPPEEDPFLFEDYPLYQPDD